MHKELTLIQNQINQFLKIASHLQESWEERQATEETMTREESTLEGELTAESKERNKLESTSIAQQKVITEAKAEKEKLQRDVIAAEKELEKLEDQLRNISRAIRNQYKTMADIEQKLSISDDKFSEKLQALIANATLAKNEAEMQEAKYKALRYLLQEKIISIPEAKVALELKDKDSTTLDHLQKTTFIGRFKVREIIEQMAKRKIVKFDKTSEQIKVLKPIDL